MQLLTCQLANNKEKVTGQGESIAMRAIKKLDGAFCIFASFYPLITGKCIIYINSLWLYYISVLYFIF